MLKDMEKYFSKHPMYNGFVHILIGIGIGILINPYTLTHPVRFGVGLILAGIILHLYPLFVKEK